MKIFSVISAFVIALFESSSLPQDKAPVPIQKSPVQVGADGSLYVQLKNNKIERVITDLTRRYELTDGTIVYASVNKLVSVNYDIQVNFFDSSALKIPKMISTEITPMAEYEVSLTLTSDYTVPTLLEIKTKTGDIKKIIDENNDVVLVIKKNTRTSETTISVNSKNFVLPSSKPLVIEATKAPADMVTPPVATEITPAAQLQTQYPNTKAPTFQPFKLASPTQPN